MLVSDMQVADKWKDDVNLLESLSYLRDRRIYKNGV